MMMMMMMMMTMTNGRNVATDSLRRQVVVWTEQGKFTLHTSDERGGRGGGGG